MPNRLDDPKEFQRVRETYFEPEVITDKSNEELMEEQSQRRRLSTNQAR